ncbi:MAG: hypothetical protein ACOY4H_13190 [Thermodesulfobacteriota bacterium]
MGTGPAASEEHFQKALMETGQVGIAFTTVEADFTEDLRFITILTEAAITVLDIVGGENHSIGNFDEIVVVPAVRTTDPHAFFVGRMIAFLCLCLNIHLFSSCHILPILKQAICFVNYSSAPLLVGIVKAMIPTGGSLSLVVFSYSPAKVCGF